MKRFVNTIVFLTFFIISSCNSTTAVQEDKSDESSLPAEPEGMENAFGPDTIPKKHEVKEQKENLAKIEKKYGEQWGFCECVVANDSIDRAVKKITDFETPDAEKLLNRFDYVSKKCQAFLGMDANRTPEERQRHEKKVKRCLRETKNG